ncbi:MAG: 3-phosphoshikimate 1-carboxyvinyltransferase, partial [Ignavibacteriaceae bacterium]|nr:3-phosphoshikimate 1-carboxyvinyltransferase [Ignavibacteriaceae bacterium]
ELFLPGDKSISHRALIFSSLGNGKSVISNLSNAEDVNSTKGILQNCGIDILNDDSKISVFGKGIWGLQKPEKILHAGNSGTTARLLSGLLSMQKFGSVISGDESLSKRPMNRVTKPLIQMGAKLSLTDNNYLPIQIEPSNSLKAISYELDVPSAQVKSAIMIAGLFLNDVTKVIENVETRNHTEVMLSLPIQKNGNQTIISSSIKYAPIPNEYIIPSDISTASFFIVLTLLSKNSTLIIKNCSLNPSRTGILTVLKAMGAKIEIINQNISCGEIYGDILVESSKLVNVEIDSNIIPNIIDEIPILTIAGIFAVGNYKIKNAKELRVKESDRINAIVNNVKKLGLSVEEYEDGFSVSGEIKNNNCLFESFGD